MSNDHRMSISFVGPAEKQGEDSQRQLVRAASHLIPVPAEARFEDNA